MSQLPDIMFVVPVADGKYEFVFNERTGVCERINRKGVAWMKGYEAKNYGTCAARELGYFQQGVSRIEARIKSLEEDYATALAKQEGRRQTGNDIDTLNRIWAEKGHYEEALKMLRDEI